MKKYHCSYSDWSPSDLVIDMMKKYIGPKRRQFIEDEVREWHESLRICQKKGVIW